MLERWVVKIFNKLNQPRIGPSGGPLWSQQQLNTWADHLIPGLIFFWETIICREVATEWDTWQLCASVCAKPEVGISLHSMCGSLSVNVNLQCASHLTMEGKVQQRVCIDFCFRLGINGAETYKMLQAAFGESCPSWSKTFEWYSRFKSGRRSFEDDPHPGRPSTSHTEETVARVREIIRADQVWLSQRLQKKLE